MRSFFESVLDWTPRKGTRAAAKLPPDAEEKCEECFFRLVYIMKWHSIPPKVSSSPASNSHGYSLLMVLLVGCGLRPDW